tara:strand:- start:2460 stop:3932 length:1473 start_codon:yes stop_codon:yes gene_type:complete
MAQFGFGLNINETAQETGYDQYQTSLFESLGAVAADNWNFNPVISLLTLKDIQTAKQESRIANIVPRDKKLLNEEYKDLGLYFEQDEYQSVVDIMVEKKKKEKERQSIMMRGPEGSWNPLSGGFYVGAAKLAVGIGTSFLDPINIGASFVPIYGQLRFARSIAKAKSMGVKSSKAFRNTRLKRGVAEGAVGATLIEPLVYGVAQRVQADYDIYDSFLNVAFGTVIGGGLHVGAGKLRDMNTARKFNARVLANRENLSKPEGGDPEVDLYEEYYPKEVVDKMMQLDQMDAETRNKLLAKGIGDMMLDEPLNVMDIANADPTLNGTSTKKLDLQINKARKNLDDAIKFSQSEQLTSPDFKQKNVADARKKYNDLLAERKKLEKTTKTEPVVTDPIVNRTKASKQIQVESTKQNVAELSSSQQDSELGRVEARLIKLRTKQNDAGLPLDFTNKSTRKKDETLKEASEELEEVNAKSDDLENGITDYINCTQGN